MESLKIDGFCVRTIDEGINSFMLDVKYEEAEKNNKNKKPGIKKK
jgi:hypothetical protein